MPGWLAEEGSEARATMDDECLALEKVVEKGEASDGEVALLEAMLCRPGMSEVALLELSFASLYTYI